MFSEYWLHPSDDPGVAAAIALYPEVDAALRALGFAPIGAIRAWMPLEPVDLEGLTGADRRHASVVTDLARGASWDVQYAEPDGATLVSLGDFAGQPELTLKTVLADGALVQSTALDPEALSTLRCGDDDPGFVPWPDGGLYRAAFPLESPAAAVTTHRSVVARTVGQRGAPVHPLLSMDDALFARRLGGRMAGRWGFHHGLDRSGVWEQFARVEAHVAAERRRVEEAPILQRALLRLPLRAVEATLAWQERAAAHMRAGIGELLPPDELGRLPVRPPTQPGAFGQWVPPDQTPYPAAWWMQPLLWWSST